MKNRPILTGALLIVSLLMFVQLTGAPRTFAQGANAGCPKASPSPGSTPNDPHNPNDPAFVMQDTAMKMALQQRKISVAQSEQPAKKPSELVTTEQEHYQAYMDAVKKHPDAALTDAMTIWKGNNSADLQRLVIFKALEKVTSTEDTETLQFMLKALDAPESQRQECARLGRGNSLEKSIAAKRITVLESNPKLQWTTLSK